MFLYLVSGKWSRKCNPLGRFICRDARRNSKIVHKLWRDHLTRCHSISDGNHKQGCSHWNEVWQDRLSSTSLSRSSSTTRPGFYWQRRRHHALPAWIALSAEFRVELLSKSWPCQRCQRYLEQLKHLRMLFSCYNWTRIDMHNSWTYRYGTFLDQSSSIRNDSNNCQY